MTKELKIYLKKGKKDIEFIELATKNIANFKIPNFFTSNTEEVLFSVLYFGYLLGKYQDDPDNH